jgi:hypothetical protein
MPQNDSTAEDTFGFGATRRGTASAADKIRQIKPALPPDVHADLAAVDLAGHNAGFVSREAPPASEPEYRPQRMVRAELRIAVNMRVPKTAGQAFLRFCAENRYSYPEGLIEIMRRAGIPTK